MKLDGKILAQEIYNQLLVKVKKSKKNGSTPTLAVLLIGDLLPSKIYVEQKQKHAKAIGAKVVVYTYPTTVKKETLLKKLLILNNDNKTHGIIIQQPLPSHLSADELLHVVENEKDVDGLAKETNFVFPLSLALLRVLQEVFDLEKAKGTFMSWLLKQRIVIVGKGKTGGGPLFHTLTKLGVKPQVVDSKTKNALVLYKNADIVISAVGKKNVVTGKMIKKGAIVIGVGQHRENDGKLHGDFNQTDIAKVAKYYTPTPGGMGALNVAFLMENVVKAAKQQKK